MEIPALLCMRIEYRDTAGATQGPETEVIHQHWLGFPVILFKLYNSLNQMYMKRTFTLAVLLSGVLLNAQYYMNNYSTAHQNPRGLNNDAEYPVGSGLDPSWTQFHTPSSTPTWSAVQTIPFAFDFNGNPETQYKVSNSGVLTFDVATAVSAPSFTTASLPSASIPDKSVCVWGIRGTAANDYVCRKTFGAAPYRQHWIFFTSYSTASSSDYVYYSIVLEETTNNIYIVDQRNYSAVSNLALGVQLNSSTATGVNNGNNNYSSVAGTDPLPADNGYYEFIPGTRPAEDMAAISETNAEYLVLSQGPFGIHTYFRSFGSSTVTSYDMNYSVNNGPPVTANIGSANIATQGGANATHPTMWNPAVSGAYNLKVWASNINGNADTYNHNDTLSFIVTVVDTMVPRTTLLEVFTSSTCVPCVAGNANMDNNVVPNISNYTVIKYQQDFPGNGDPYQTTESVNRRGYYGINSIPRMEIDGQWDLNAQVFTVPVFNGFQQVPAFMDIAISSAYYGGTTVSVQAQIKPLITYTGNNFAYHVVVIENQTTGNVASNGETSFNDVMMNMHPTETGTAVTALNAGSPININMNIPMASSHVEQMSDLKVVIFVQDNSTKKILQSAWLDVVPNSVSDMDAQGNGITKMYPNPATDNVTLEYQVAQAQQVSWTMTNSLGQVVRQGQNVQSNQGINLINVGTENLTAGVYFMNLTTNEGVFTQRVVIAE